MTTVHDPDLLGEPRPAAPGGNREHEDGDNDENNR